MLKSPVNNLCFITRVNLKQKGLFDEKKQFDRGIFDVFEHLFVTTNDAKGF
jgi:hypothetical protein